MSTHTEALIAYPGTASLAAYVEQQTAKDSSFFIAGTLNAAFDDPVTNMPSFLNLNQLSDFEQLAAELPGNEELQQLLAKLQSAHESVVQTARAYDSGELAYEDITDRPL